jgi:hypothetical protein
MKNLVYQKQLPSKVGWYWKRNPLDEREIAPEIVYVRDYAGSLAIGNNTLDGWKGWKDCEWAGPIPMALPCDHGQDNVEQLLAQFATVQKAYIGDSPLISNECARRLLTASCKTFLGLTD